MNSHFRLPFAILLLLGSLATLSFGSQTVTINLATPEQIKEQFLTVPCKDEDRLSAVTTLFQKMGASVSDISVEKYKDVENLVVRIRGSSAETIVVGAHYDKVSAGCGAIDNWTGIVAIALIYIALKSLPLRKTILFVAFGKEEKGLKGSRAMVEAIQEGHIAQYCAMINIDSLGLAAPQVLENASSQKLTSLTEDVATKLAIPFAKARVEVADSDSSSFKRRKIPAVTLHALSNEFVSVVHTGKDTPTQVNAMSVYLGYRLALSMIVRLDAAQCNAYR